MAIVAVVAGAYTNTWSGLNLNYTKQGYNLHMTPKAERVEETDLYALNLIDMIYRGYACSIDAVYKVFSSAVMRAAWEWTLTMGRAYYVSEPLGSLASNGPSALTLTAVANTPAATAGNIATLTAPGTIISPDTDVQIALDSRGRDVPIKFDLLLTDAGGVGSFFVAT